MGINGEKSVKLGDIVDFGGYAWRVLDIQDGQALLLSELVLENRPYNEKYGSITWEKCTLRHYLNGEFYEKFSAADRKRIVRTDVKNDDNQWFGTDGGNDTADYVFLLSLEEVVRYFGGDVEGRLKKPHTNLWKSYFGDDFMGKRFAKNANGKRTDWWLRSPGIYPHYATRIMDYGIDIGGLDADSTFYGEDDYVGEGGVRPALWLNL